MKISDMAFVLRIKIGCWGAQKTDREISDEVLESKQADQDAGRFVKNILGKCPQLEAVKKHAASFRQSIASKTIPIGHGSYVIPIMETEEFLSFVKQNQCRFEELVNDFINDYPEIVESIKQSHNALFNEEHCPPPSSIRHKFYFTYRIEPMPRSNGFDTAFDLEGLEQELKDEYDNQLNEMRQHGEELICDRLALQLHKLRESMLNYEGKRGQLTSKIFNKTKEVIENVNKLNIMGDSNITNWCNQASLVVSTHPAEQYRNNVMLRNDGIRELGRILTEMNQGDSCDDEVEEVSTPTPQVVQQEQSFFSNELLDKAFQDG